MTSNRNHFQSLAAALGLVLALAAGLAVRASAPSGPPGPALADECVTSGPLYVKDIKVYGGGTYCVPTP
jgi:hypothetical protein